MVAARASSRFREANFRASEFRRLFHTADYPKLIAAGGIPTFFDKWSRSRNAFLGPRPATGSDKWTPELAEAFYSAQLWQLVKTWEITRNLILRSRGLRRASGRIQSRPAPLPPSPASRTVPPESGGALWPTITEAFLSAWLDKTLQYPPASYFVLGAPPAVYQLSPQLREITGGRVWDASPRFRAAGVKPALVERLDAWGRALTAVAELFHY